MFCPKCGDEFSWDVWKDVATVEEGLARVKKEHEAWSEEQKRSGDASYQQQLAKLTPTADRFWADGVARLSEAEQDLGALSPDQGAAPACLLERVEASRPLSRFVAATTVGCRPVIRPKNLMDR